ncbi:MAG: hypothetical protein HQM08_30650 [Candidatus Riflebacteria bacterium]|nr:hypothetical protein [Candidatus Riflebacteria bacterium]
MAKSSDIEVSYCGQTTKIVNNESVVLNPNGINSGSLKEPTDEELTALEKRARTVFSFTQMMACPWIAEFSGLPRAGKSECIATITHFLRRHGFTVLSPFEGASQAPDYLKDDLLLYNTWTASYAIRQIIQALRVRNPNKYDVVLIDRGLFDAIAWFHYLEKEKTVKPEVREIMTKYMQIPFWKEYIQRVFLLLCSHEQALKRELNSKLTNKPGTVLSEGRLRDLRKNYCEMQSLYETIFKIDTIETDSATPKAVGFKVISIIFSDIEQRRHYQ